MKRLALALMLIAAGLSVCWAADLLETKNLEVSLDLGTESSTTWYDFGFSSSQVGSGKGDNSAPYNPTTITSISLALDDEGVETGRIAENADDSLWVYWHITSGSGLQISISGDDDMKKASPKSEDEKITWNVAVDSASAKNRSESQVVYTHTPSEDGVGADGSKEISLSTDDLTGLTLTPGEYTANLVLSITKN